MRYAIDLVPLDFSKGNIVDVRIKGFRRVIGSSLVERRGGLVLADRNGASKQKVIQCALVMEWDPDGADEELRFVGVPVGLCVDSAGVGAESLEHVATVIAPGQPPFAIYAVPRGAVPAEVVAQDSTAS